MKLNFTIDTEDLYETESTFEGILTDSLRREIIKNAKSEIVSEKFSEFSKLTSETIVADIKLRLMNFLSEEIVLTGRYGEKEFVGSIEDLIKKRLDDILLRPVNTSGQTLQGCTTDGRTWIEWAIESEIKEKRERILKEAKETVLRETEKKIAECLVEYKNKTIKEQVEKTFMNIIKQ